MRRLIYSMTVSLDGYIAGPDGAIDWTVMVVLGGTGACSP